MDIDTIRKQINQLDEDLLRIFNQRAALALEIGEVKKQLGLPIYDPGREKLIFERMKEKNNGPLDNSAIIRLFERVIDESRSLERTHAKGEN
ncbi:chorismate mutase [uncultured Desulfuromusa sp.]|uniref:chorismate mutase n=1 Tax=uncultured Desulfuromusa sp. TaxID=219183 RepID=UPI002AA8D19B|nr:chorismate mutase [uncultured Desulfuromusa sp.]